MSPKITDGMTIDAMLAELGRRLAAWRIARRYTQAQMADLAGVSRATLQRMESGHGGELRTFLSALAALDRVSALETLLPEVPPSPIEMLKRAGRQPKRVRASSKPPAPAAGWKWGDER